MKRVRRRGSSELESDGQEERCFISWVDVFFSEDGEEQQTRSLSGGQIQSRAAD